MDSHRPPSRPTLLQDSAEIKAPLAASSQPITNEVDFNLDRPGRTIQVKIEPSASPPLLPSTTFNSECPHDPPAASLTIPIDVIDLTRSPPARQLNLDRPLHKARSSGLASTTTPPAINLDRPLRKAKSAQSYEGLPPSASTHSLGPGNGTHPSLKDEMTREHWADEKLAFPRSKVGNGFYRIFGD